jgi:hypothetical protein
VAANWIADTNTFKLEQPPEWWMQRLYDFDHQLVLLPSRKKAEYLLARRRQLTAGLGDVAMLDNQDPDTNMCYAHGVIPIAPLRWKDNTAKVWSQATIDALLAELRGRDSWALGAGPGGDPDAAWKAVEYAEALQARKDQQSLREKFYHMGRDAYRSLKARSGQRNKRASDHHGVARTPQTKQRVILTDASQ